MLIYIAMVDADAAESDAAATAAGDGGIPDCHDAAAAAAADADASMLDACDYDDDHAHDSAMIDAFRPSS